jgi:dTDP-glucose 4,6-dehydratase
MGRKAVAITGGAGFIGSHLCLRLVESGYNVTCIDNLITGNLKNIEPLVKNRDFVFIKHDVSKNINLIKKVDYVLHCASLASPKDYLDLPIQTLKAGSLGTHNALGLAKKNKAVFMLFSTSEVYGDPLVHPQRESYWGNVNPVGVRGCYDESKRFAEALTMAYHRTHKLDIKIARIFNTYGPGMRSDDGRVVPNLINQALRNRPLTVYGKGSQTRSFCYIDEPVNLGNPVEFTIMELARLILKLTGSNSAVNFKKLPQDDPMQRKPEISKARKHLKWKPKISLEQGLKKTIAYFK